MSDEHDSWFSNVFGVDLGGAAQKIQAEAQAAFTQVSNVVTQVQTTVGSAIDGAVGAVTGAVQKVAGAAGGGAAGGGGLRAGGPGASAGGGTGKFPLSGSVGRGGQNSPNDVKAVQRALGISVDGQCGGGTIAAIENFQRQIGSKPDGRVDAGGGTERALAGGAKPAAKPADADGGGLFDKFMQAKQGLEGSVQSQLQSMQNSAFEALGISPETAQLIRDGEQAIADFEKGREKGNAEATLGFLDILPPVQAVKAAARIASADDKEAEAAKILQEKSQSAAALGEFLDNPIGGAAKMGANVGTNFAKNTLKAKEEGKLAERMGELAGHAQFAGQLAGITFGVGELVGGGALAAEGGTAAAEEAPALIADGAEDGAALVAEDSAPSLRPISPLAEDVPPPRTFGDAPTQLGGDPLPPQISPLAQDVPTPRNFGDLPTQLGGEPLPPEIGPLAEQGGGAADPLTIVPEAQPVEPLPFRPTEIPKGPEFAPTRQPPGPAPDFGPNTPNPFEDPFNPRFPKPPRVPPDIDPIPPPDTVPEVEPVFEPGVEELPPDTIPESQPPVFEES